jgi:AP-3 complex subunit sigma
VSLRGREGTGHFFVDETVRAQVHHILAEIIQGGVVLETNLDEIDSSGKIIYTSSLFSLASRKTEIVTHSPADIVHQAASARKQSFAAANPLALGVGGVGPRSTGLQTPLGWLTGKLTGVGAR